MPLLIEIELLVLGAWLVGLAIGWLLFGRPKRQGFL